MQRTCGNITAPETWLLLLSDVKRWLETRGFQGLLRPAWPSATSKPSSRCASVGPVAAPSCITAYDCHNNPSQQTQNTTPYRLPACFLPAGTSHEPPSTQSLGQLESWMIRINEVPQQRICGTARVCTGCLQQHPAASCRSAPARRPAAAAAPGRRARPHPRLQALETPHRRRRRLNRVAPCHHHLLAGRRWTATAHPPGSRRNRPPAPGPRRLRIDTSGLMVDLMRLISFWM